MPLSVYFKNTAVSYALDWYKKNGLKSNSLYIPLHFFYGHCCMSSILNNSRTVIIELLIQLINIMKIFRNRSVRESLYWVITGYKFVTCIKSLMKINFVSSSADDISNLLTVSYLPLLPVRTSKYNPYFHSFILWAI